MGRDDWFYDGTHEETMTHRPRNYVICATCGSNEYEDFECSTCIVCKVKNCRSCSHYTDTDKRLPFCKVHSNHEVNEASVIVYAKIEEDMKQHKLKEAKAKERRDKRRLKEKKLSRLDRASKELRRR